MNQNGITTKRCTAVKPMAAKAVGMAWIMLFSYRRHPSRGLCGGER